MYSMKQTCILALSLVFIFSCTQQEPTESNNPFFTALNEPVDYASASADDLKAYAEITIDQVSDKIASIKSIGNPTFETLFVPYDEARELLSKARNNCHTLYWVSPDSLTRIFGKSGNQMLDSLGTAISTDRSLFDLMSQYRATTEYETLENHRKKYVDDLIANFEHSGVNLSPEKLAKLKALNAQELALTSQYSLNMNSSNRIIEIDESGAEGLPENFKNKYRTADGSYEIPAIPATSGPVMSNATQEKTRKAFYLAYTNRGMPDNLVILDELIQLRYEIGQLMGHDSYAGYNLKPKMASNPETVWQFLNDLVELAKPKSKLDMEKLKQFRNQQVGLSSNEPIAPHNYSFYVNELLKSKYQVDNELIREYLPMENCLSGMLEIYQELLGYEFVKVQNPSVWHEEVELYEVYEDDKLRGRFYLDLFPRPNKESWFYGVSLGSGRLTEEGYEVPVKMLLGNFSRPNGEVPSLLSLGELNTLFHEFGHIMDGISYHGEIAGQSGSKRDFVESMSQIFENWIADYEILSSLTQHYQTGEILPKEIFENKERSKNITSGISAIRSLRNAIYDLTLYDKYNPNAPMSTTDLWKEIDDQLGIAFTTEGSHPHASWIHINTHPVYYYGYIWSEVYAQDMFTQFEENGLLDQATGKRYRDIILANGSQQDVVTAVETFLGRPSNNKAYIKSLGLED